MPKIPLHFQIADKVISLLAQGSHKQTYVDRLENGTIEQVQTDIKSFTLSGEIFISSADVYVGLTQSAIKLIIRIQQELVMNNPLWHCPDKSSPTVRSGLAQLKRKGILDAIDGTDIFIVNPAKIRKGRPLAVYGALYQYAKRQYSKNPKWSPTTDDIKKLISPKELDHTELLIQQYS